MKEQKINGASCMGKVHSAVVLCAGQGTSSRAMKDAGFKVHGIDYWDVAEQGYRQNFPDAKFELKSLRALTADWICESFGLAKREIDLVQLSNPCTATSKTGDQLIFSAVNDLYFAGLKLALDLEPKVILMENVEALTHKEMEVLLAMVRSFIKRYGEDYIVEARVLNAHRYGDPQTRSRVFINLTRRDVGVPVWPEPVEEGLRRTIRDVFPDAEYLTSTNYGTSIYYPDEPAPTVTGHPNMQVHEFGVDRNVTPQEYAALMGLPSDFVLVGTIEQQKLAAGNGICYGVMSSIAQAIMKQLENLLSNNPSDTLPRGTQNIDGYESNNRVKFPVISFG